MPNTCKACSHPERKAIEAAMARGESLRNIAKRYGTSATALHRHRGHAGQALVQAAERRELSIGDSVLEGLARVQKKAWELLERLEADGDHRGAITALRECRAVLEALDAILARARGPEPTTIILPKWMMAGESEQLPAAPGPIPIIGRR